MIESIGANPVASSHVHGAVGHGAEGERTQEEQARLRELRARDREVRAHEAAHKAAAGDLARGGASFEFEVGPDGQRYAVAGEVSIDTSPVPGDPAATLDKARRIIAAALAPAQPSAQDRRVAAQAAAMAAQAQQELARESAPETPTLDRVV